MRRMVARNTSVNRVLADRVDVADTRATLELSLHRALRFRVLGVRSGERIGVETGPRVCATFKQGGNVLAAHMPPSTGEYISRTGR